MKTASAKGPADGTRDGQSPREAHPRRSKSDGDVLRGMLTGYYDTANIGRYTFSLMNGVQLKVGSPREPGSVGGQFWLEHMPAGTWHRLKDRGGRLLPIWIQWHGNELRAAVGDGPSNAPVLLASDAGR